MGLFSRKPKSDWKYGGQTPDGRAIAYDKKGNVQTTSVDGEVITYDNRGTVISRTGGSNDNAGPGSSNDRAIEAPSTTQTRPKIDQVKPSSQTPVNYSPSQSSATGGVVGSGSQASTISYNPPEATKPKPKVEFKTAANGDLLQRAEGGNWYVAKDNPDPVSNVTSPSEGMNKKYGLGEYASPTANDALASRSEGLNDRYSLGEQEKSPAAAGAPAVDTGLTARSQAMNEQHNLGDFAGSRSPAGAASKTATDPRSEALNKQYGLGEYASQPSASPTTSGADAKSLAMNEHYGLGESAPATSSAPAWHANPNWKTADSGSATTAGLDASQVLEQRAGNNGNTIFRMKDGTYQAYNPETGLHSAGTWDNSQWAGSDYASPTVSAVQSSGQSDATVNQEVSSEPSISTTTNANVSTPVPTAQELVSGYDYSGPSTAAPSAPVATYSTPVPVSQTPVSSYNPEVEETNLTRQWVAAHRDEPVAASAPQPVTYSEPASVAAATNYSPADQYSGHVDMAEIERSVAEYTKSQTPAITLPGQSDIDPAGVAGLDSSSGGDYLNPGRLAGRGRHYAE